MNFGNVAYTPLDIPRMDIDFTDLHRLMETHGKQHQPYPELWQAYAVCGRMDDFDDGWDCDNCWNDRYNTDPNIKWNPHTPEHMNDIFKKMLAALPYKLCTFAQILSQKMHIPPHQDGLYDVSKSVRGAVYDGAVDFNGETEPAGLKIILSHRDKNSFYILPSPGGKRQHITLPEDTNHFTINERKFWHGARYLGEPKYILSTFGIIDTEKQQELVSRSLQKYDDYSIILEDKQ
tara:strand:+ start:3901 stop:4602 length:702 start_codon:yes stop_codon:yes gene_type:complete